MFNAIFNQIMVPFLVGTSLLIAIFDLTMLFYHSKIQLPNERLQNYLKGKQKDPKL